MRRAENLHEEVEALGAMRKPTPYVGITAITIWVNR